MKAFPLLHKFPRLASLGIVLLSGALPTSADTVTPLWTLAPDDRPYVTTGNLERGIAFNPVSGNALLLSRAGTPSIYVLRGTDGSDGSEETGEPRVLSSFDEAGENPISGGTFTLNLVGAADDGAVFACNLATSLGTVRIYRWANDEPDTPISIAYSGDPLEGVTDPGSGQDIRFGDNFAVRGSGTGTQLVQTSRNGKFILLYTTTDGLTFTPTVIPSPANVVGKLGLGVAFGEADTLWGKVSGNALQRIQLSPASSPPSAQLLNEIPTTVVGTGVTGLGSDPVLKRLAAIDYVNHTVTVFDVSDPVGLVPLADPVPFPASNANANGTGAAALSGETLVAVESNNGVLALRIEKSVVADPPNITSQPVGGTVYEGASFTLAVAAQGTPPFGYQWIFNDTVFLPGATNAQLILTNVTQTQAGTYAVAITNAANTTVTSTPATLTVKAPLHAGILNPLWSLLPGDRPYLTSDNTQRGLAFNPATGNLLVASRSPANTIAVLDGATGAHRHNLRLTNEEDVPVITGGTLTLNMVAVADDGVVYAANLVTDASAASFQLYRWANDGPDTVPSVTLLPGDLVLAERWGDTLDVRGSAATTQILLGSRGLAPQEGRKFAVLSTQDGLEFTGQVFTVADVPSSAFGLGIAFGPGNTVFGTANGQPLVHVAFNPADGTASLARSYTPEEVPTALSFLGTLPSSNLLAAVAFENPDNVQLFRIGNQNEATLIDQRLILPKQPNSNGTGSIDFGGDRLFVLDTNHGLRAFDVDFEGGTATPARLGAPTLQAGSIQFTLTGAAGSEYSVQKSPDFNSWSDVGTFTSPATVTDPTGPGPVFYRALAR